MEIKFMFRGKVYALCLGYKTPWFAQVDFVTFMEEFYNDDSMECNYADMKFKAFRAKEFKNL